MIVTQKGRVVYERKKHYMNERDLARITTKLCETEKPFTIWQAVRNTFAEIWRKTSMTLPEAIEWVDVSMDDLLLFVELVVTVVGLKASKIAGYEIPPAPAGTALQRYAVESLRNTADTIEERSI